MRRIYFIHFGDGNLLATHGNDGKTCFIFAFKSLKTAQRFVDENPEKHLVIESKPYSDLVKELNDSMTWRDVNGLAIGKSNSDIEFVTRESIIRNGLEIINASQYKEDTSLYWSYHYFYEINDYGNLRVIRHNNKKYICISRYFTEFLNHVHKLPKENQYHISNAYNLKTLINRVDSDIGIAFINKSDSSAVIQYIDADDLQNVVSDGVEFQEINEMNRKQVDKQMCEEYFVMMTNNQYHAVIIENNHGETMNMVAISKSKQALLTSLVRMGINVINKDFFPFPFCEILETVLISKDLQQCDNIVIFDDTDDARVLDKASAQQLLDEWDADLAKRRNEK